jgi:hypothetical protein
VGWLLLEAGPAKVQGAAKAVETNGDEPHVEVQDGRDSKPLHSRAVVFLLNTKGNSL